MPLIRKGPDGAAPNRSVQQDLAALRDGDPDQRRAAARRLATLPSATGALGTALGGEADRRVREAIFTGLARRGGDTAVDAVLPYLRSDDSNLRTGALDALRAMVASVRPRLPALLADSDPDVRILSCELVRELPSADATSLLCAVLDRDEAVNVCAGAVDVLAEIGDRAALPALERCAARFAGQGFLHFAIQTAIERIRMQQAATDE